MGPVPASGFRTRTARTAQVNIPEEAIEAAEKAFHKAPGISRLGPTTYWSPEIKTVIEVAMPYIRKRIEQEIRDSADPVYYSSFDKSGYSQGYRAGLRHALKVVKGDGR